MPSDLSLIAKRLVERAAAAQSKQDDLPPAPSVLKHYCEDARAVAIAVLQAMIPPRKSAGHVVMELPELGRVQLGELIAAVEKVEVP